MFLWGSTLFLGSRMASNRTFAIFIERRAGWVADAVCALIGDDRVALEATHQGLKVTGARWARYGWLPVPEARALKHALAYARRTGRKPRVPIAAFLVDVCKIPQKDVARSLIWPSSRVGFRTGAKRQQLHLVSRAWFGTGPQRWPIDTAAIQVGRAWSAIWWEARLLVVFVAVIFGGLVLGQLLLGGSP